MTNENSESPQNLDDTEKIYNGDAWYKTKSNIINFLLIFQKRLKFPPNKKKHEF